jgi:predicted DNA binding CopG/RHH family protein
MAEEKKVRINIPLDEELHRELKLKAVREGIELQKLIPRLLEQALKGKEECGVGA